MKRINIGKYTLIPRQNQSHAEWLSTRQEGIGGSDTGTVLNVNEYCSITELFYQKLGRTPPVDLSENAAVHYGNVLEPIILNESQYFDIKGKENNHLKNMKEGRKLASHVEFDYMIINNDFPWIISNVDGLGFYDKNVTKQDLVDQVNNGQMPCPDYVVEIKTMDSFVRDKFEDGMRPDYPIQVKTYCTAFLEQNKDLYGMIYKWCYDKTLTATHVELDQQSIVDILTKTKDLYELIKVGKNVIKEGYKLKLSEDEIDQNLSEIHPDFITSLVSQGQFLSNNFLAKEYVKKNQTVLGDEEDLKLGIRHQQILKETKKLTAEKTSISNHFKMKLVKNKSKVIDLKDKGKISFGKRLTINVKQ